MKTFTRALGDTHGRRLRIAIMRSAFIAVAVLGSGFAVACGGDNVGSQSSGSTPSTTAASGAAHVLDGTSEMTVAEGEGTEAAGAPAWALDDHDQRRRRNIRWTAAAEPHPADADRADGGADGRASGSSLPQ